MIYLKEERLFIMGVVFSSYALCYQRSLRFKIEASYYVMRFPQNGPGCKH